MSKFYNVCCELKKRFGVIEKVARNQSQPCNENPTSAGWDSCACLQLSVRFFLRNSEIAHKIASCKSSLTLLL